MHELLKTIIVLTLFGFLVLIQRKIETVMKCFNSFILSLHNKGRFKT